MDLQSYEVLFYVNLLVRFLFDTGSSISVIAHSFADNLGLEPVDSGTCFQFEIVIGTHTVPKHICYKCPFIVDDKLFE